MPACLRPARLEECANSVVTYAQRVPDRVLTGENGPQDAPTQVISTRECALAGSPPHRGHRSPQPGRWTMRVSPPFQLATRSSEMMLTWLPDVPTKCIPRLRMA